MAHDPEGQRLALTRAQPITRINASEAATTQTASLTAAERETILRLFVESCLYRAEFIPLHDEERSMKRPTISADVYLENIKTSTVRAINTGYDSWDRIIQVAAVYKRQCRQQLKP